MSWFSKVLNKAGNSLGDFAGDILSVGNSFSKALGKSMGWNDPFNALGDPIGFLTGANQAQWQNQQNLDFWNKENDYNSPSSQAARYTAAGFNPNVIYGQISSGNAGSLSSAGAPDGASTLSKSMSSFQAVMAARNLIAQNKNLNAQNSLINSQTAAQQALTRKQNLENSFFEKNGVWPAQEGGFVRSAKSLINFFPEMFFRMVDVFDGIYSKDTLRSVGDSFRR